MSVIRWCMGDGTHTYGGKRMSKRKAPKKHRTGYQVMVRFQDPSGSEHLEPYTGHIFSDILSAHDEKWLADHDGEVYGAYIREVDR